jgi:hypothetical protein
MADEKRDLVGWEEMKTKTERTWNRVWARNMFK